MFLPERMTGLREQMDDPACDPLLLHNTYAQFSAVNRLVSGWQRVFDQQLLPLLLQLGSHATLLDVGCGAGDVTLRLAGWAERAGVQLEVTGIDPDPRALAFARSHAPVPGVTFLQATADELAASGSSYDFVISNHLLHHLADTQLLPFLATSVQLARLRVVHNDLRRHVLALAAFTLSRPFFRRSFITEDGLRSIRRSFTTAELAALAPPGWRTEQLAPFRNLLIHDA